MPRSELRTDVETLANECYPVNSREEFAEYSIAVARLALEAADLDRGQLHATIGTLRLMLQAAVKNLRDLDTSAARGYANLLVMELRELFDEGEAPTFKPMVELLDDEIAEQEG